MQVVVSRDHDMHRSLPAAHASRPCPAQGSALLCMGHWHPSCALSVSKPSWHSCLGLLFPVGANHAKDQGANSNCIAIARHCVFITL